MKALGGSKVANLSSVADTELTKPKEKTPNKKPISFFFIIFPPNKLIYYFSLALNLDFFILNYV